MQKEKLNLFEGKSVRTIWDEEHEKWYFSVVDVVAVLTESTNPQTYWRVLKKRLKEEGNETVTNCNGLKLHAPDGKMRLTDVADTEGILRIIQSIPSPKAEPFKLWMAQVGASRIDQLQDPELSIDQAILDYKRLGVEHAVGVVVWSGRGLSLTFLCVRRNEPDAEGGGDTEETRQLNIGLSPLHTGNVTLLAAKAVGQFLLGHLQFMASLPKHIAVKPRDGLLVELIPHRRAMPPVFVVQHLIGC